MPTFEDKMNEGESIVAGVRNTSPEESGWVPVYQPYVMGLNRCFMQDLFLFLDKKEAEECLAKMEGGFTPSTLSDSGINIMFLKKPKP